MLCFLIIGKSNSDQVLNLQSDVPIFGPPTSLPSEILTNITLNEDIVIEQSKKRKPGTLVRQPGISFLTGYFSDLENSEKTQNTKKDPPELVKLQEAIKSGYLTLVESIIKEEKQKPNWYVFRYKLI